jgi:hypothetical protein
MSEIDLATIVVAISTVVLAVITGIYMWETRRIRLAGQQPSFSLETTSLTLGEDPLHMHIVNTGESATELRIDCSWSNQKKKLYAASLGKRGRLPLKGVPIPTISQAQDNLTVKINCKDSRGGKFDSEIKMDFAISKAEEREVAYQYNQMETSLRDIAFYLAHG